MKLLVLPIVLFFTIGLNAQQPLIAIKGVVTDTIAFTLQQAIDIAQPNDKIYLPGGIYSLTDSIQKNVHIIGTGYNDLIERLLPVSTFIGDILIGSDAQGLILEGIRTNNTIRVRTNNVIVRRCFAAINAGGNNHNFINCVIHGTFHGGNYSNINNCVIETIGQIVNTGNFTNVATNFCQFYNTVVLGIIWGGGSLQGNCVNSTFYNCVIFGFKVNNSVAQVNCNLIFGNQMISTLCANGNGGTLNSYFYNNQGATNLLSDFTLSSSAPIQNIGIYHGNFPWKDGGQPINPHIIENNSFLDVQNEEFKLRVKVVPQTN